MKIERQQKQLQMKLSEYIYLFHIICIPRINHALCAAARNALKSSLAFLKRGEMQATGEAGCDAEDAENRTWRGDASDFLTLPLHEPFFRIPLRSLSRTKGEATGEYTSLEPHLISSIGRSK